MRIIVRNNDPIKAYKVLSRKLREDGTFTDLKEKQFYKSKSEKRREAMKRAIAKQKKDIIKQTELFEKLEKMIPKKNKRINNDPRKPNRN